MYIIHFLMKIRKWRNVNSTIKEKCTYYTQQLPITYKHTFKFRASTSVAYEALVEGMISFVFSLKHKLISKTFWKYAKYIISNGFFKIFTMTKLIPCLIYQTGSQVSFQVIKLMEQSIPRMPSMLGYQVPLQYVI